MSGPVDWSKSEGGASQGYGDQGYGDPAPYGQRAPYPPPVPPTHAGWAVASVIFFWPLAFVAFTASSNVTRLWVMGDYAGAQAASDQAKRMGKISLIILAVLAALYVVGIIAFISLVANTVSNQVGS